MILTWNFINFWVVINRTSVPNPFVEVPRQLKFRLSTFTSLGSNHPVPTKTWREDLPGPKTDTPRRDTGRSRSGTKIWFLFGRRGVSTDWPFVLSSEIPKMKVVKKKIENVMPNIFKFGIKRRQEGCGGVVSSCFFWRHWGFIHTSKEGWSVVPSSQRHL